MPLDVATHSGSFHADEVLAFALIRVFLDPEASITRTRDLDRIEEADVAIDVGGIFDPARQRFDHHQASYEGELSSAGMVLEWLTESGRIPEHVATALRRDLVTHVDAVDTGRTAPTQGVPCISILVATFNHEPESAEERLEAYLAAVAMAERVVRGVRADSVKIAEATEAVRQAMAEAEASGTRVMQLDRYHPWKRPYFDAGGAQHPTDYLLFPSDGDWRVMAIPVELGSFENKRSLPEQWGGLVDDELSRVVGVEGAVFCHKNRFLAVFHTEAAARQALESWQLTTRTVKS